MLLKYVRINLWSRVLCSRRSCGSCSRCRRSRWSRTPDSCRAPSRSTIAVSRRRPRRRLVHGRRRTSFRPTPARSSLQGGSGVAYSGGGVASRPSRSPPARRRRSSRPAWRSCSRCRRSRCTSADDTRPPPCPSRTAGRRWSTSLSPSPADTRLSTQNDAPTHACYCSHDATLYQVFFVQCDFRA